MRGCGNNLKSTVPTPLMAAEEAEKQSQGGINHHVWTHPSSQYLI